MGFQPSTVAPEKLVVGRCWKMGKSFWNGLFQGRPVSLRECSLAPKELTQNDPLLSGEGDDMSPGDIVQLGNENMPFSTR